MRRIRGSSFLLASALLFVSSEVLAGGFQLLEHSASGLGRAFSGEAVIGDDASILAANPAGMGLIRKKTFSGGVTMAAPSFDLFVEKATLETNIDLIVKVNAKTEVSGNSGGAKSSRAVIPSLFYVSPYNKKWTWGFGIYSNFGLSSEEDEQFAGRFSSGYSDILTLNINPSVSYRYSKKLWLGFGMNGIFGKVAGGRAIPDFLTVGGSIFSGAIGGLIPGLDLGSLASGDIDGGRVDVSGEGFALSWNAGLLYKLSRRTRIGLSYRPGVSISFTGRAEFSNCSEGNKAILGSLSDVCGDGFNTETPLNLPAIMRASVYHRLTRKWSLHGDVTQTKWQSFNSLKVFNTDKQSGDNVFYESTGGFKDTLRYALGATYWHSRRYQLRLGFAKDETPVGDDARTIEAPDSNRTILSLGGRYKKSSRLSFDIGYAHYIFENYNLSGRSSPLQKFDLGVGTIDVSTTVTGNGATAVDMFSAQVNWNF